MPAGPVRDCSHKRAFHAHGTRNSYVLDKCRCGQCREAHRAYENRRARNKVYSRPTTVLVDAEPVRRHMRELMAAGMGWKTIARAAGVYPSSVYPILYGRNGTDPRPPRKRVRGDIAQALLGVELTLAGGAVVDATGARRRLQALVALGWSRSDLGRRIGVTPQNFGSLLVRGHLTAKTVRAVAQLYDELSMTLPPQDTHRQKISVARARGDAQRRGWRPPLAWDDDTIDRPFAGQYIADLVEPVRWYHARGWNDAQIAAELSRSRKTINTLRRRLALPVSTYRAGAA